MENAKKILAALFLSRCLPVFDGWERMLQVQKVSENCAVILAVVCCPERTQQVNTVEALI